MGTKKIFNIIIALLLLATAAMGCLLYITWIGVREENIERRLDESRLLYQLNKLSDEKKYNEEYYRRLVYDEAFAERVIREKMGYVGKNEIVFRFKDSTPVSVDTRMSPKFFPRLDASKPAPKLSPETLDEEVEEAEPPQNKSLLRRLFSKSDGEKTEKEIEPKIRIDMSDPQNVSVAEIKSDNPQGAKISAPMRIGFDNAAAEKSAALKTEIAEPQPNEKKSAAAKTPEKPKTYPSSPNAIRFRAD